MEEKLDEKAGVPENTLIEEKFTVYLLTNSVNNKIYVGQTKMSLIERFKNGRGYSGNTDLFSDLEKDGPEKFCYSVLAEVSSEKEADKLKTKYIIKYDSRNPEKGYNLSEGPTMTGLHHTSEAKTRISEAMKGRVMPREVVERGAIKRRMDPEREAAILKAYLEGTVITKICEELDCHVSAIYRVLDRNNIERKRPLDGWKGRTHSEETKAKMSQSAKDRWDGPSNN